MHKINALITLSIISIFLSSCSWPQNVSKKQGGVVIADKGQAKAVIVVAGNANKNALDAAKALQKTVHQMTDVELLIQNESEFKGQVVPILVGMSKIVGKAGVVIEQDKDADDHYIISVNDKQIILAGNDAGRRRGSAYAVYDLLGRLGCGWYRTEPLWHVIPKRATLEIPRMYVDEKPAFEFRDIWFVNNEQLLIDAWRMGGRRISMGHDLDRLVPEKVYGKEHPEYFGEYQPCLTHPDVVEIIVNKFREKLDRQKGLVSFSLSARDTAGYCECDNCKAVGNISTRMLNLANNVARKLAKTHPNRYLLTFYAYWHSHEPPEPMLKAEHGVCAIFVNEGNHVRSWEEPETPEVAKELPRPILREVNYFTGWKKTGAILGMYEWWIPSFDKDLDWLNIPWYPGDTTLKNLRYWKRSGVRFVTHENDEPYKKKEDRVAIRWPVYYVGARGMWDVNVTSEQVMREACEKLYGPASEPMFGFYQVIEKAMSQSKHHGYAGRLPNPELIYTDDIQEEATGFLERAASLANEKKIRQRIAHESRMWAKARAVMAEFKEGPSKKSTTGKIVLVDDKIARAAIMVANNANKNTMDAASALQDAVGQMTGVELAIQKESKFDNQAMPIFVGMSTLVENMGINIVQDKDAGERYIIRVDNKGIVLAGNDDVYLRGSIHAVYDFLGRLGCGWYRPDPLWHVIPKRSTLKVEPMNIEEEPAFAHRDIWNVRDKILKDAWRVGGWHVSHEHILWKYFPRKKYIDEHPEYFGAEQPCLTHPDVIKIIADKFRKKIDRKKGIVPFSLSANDTGGYCECDSCKAIGNISARMLNFANSVARELAETHPGRYLLTFYPYWHSHEPPEPMLKAEPGVCAMFVNEGNRVRSWEEPETEEVAKTLGRPILREINYFAGWQKTGALLGIYDYWIPAFNKNLDWLGVPWYPGDTTLKNLRYWKRGGVRFVTYETDEPFESEQRRFSCRWLLYYVGARGMWDPDVSSKEVMREACDKLYGRVSDDMFNYYQVIERTMSKSKLVGYNWHLPRPDKIYTELTGDFVGTYLNRAFALAGDETTRERIAQEKRMWDSAWEMMAKLRDQAVEKDKIKTTDDYDLAHVKKGKESKKTDKKAKSQKPNRKVYPPIMPEAKVEVYKTVGDIKLNMYIFNPEGHKATDERPAIVFFFGGGWVRGSPGQFYHQCRYFASRGMVAMAADYRVISRHGIKTPQCVSDAKSAIRWARANAERLGIDANRIVAGGGSAGGHLAACTGTLGELDEPTEDLSISSRPNAMVLFNPVLITSPVKSVKLFDEGNDWYEKRSKRIGIEPKRVSPYHHISKDTPAAIILIGTKDKFYESSQFFTEEMNKMGNRCELDSYEDMPHGFFNFGKFDNKPFVRTLRTIDKFLASLGYLEGEPTIDEFVIAK